jgi:outer membrane protein OmpA-like peptidoglycan-associated protein
MAFRGCVDSDKDGVADPDDKCPNQAGPASNAGCPELKVEEKKALADALAGVQFETNSDKIKPASFKILDNVANVAKKYPSYKLMIAGHTDSQGDDAKNLDLSKRRAKACYDYLVKKGVNNPAEHDGFGETKPVGDNNTAAGRAKNRRVEFELVPN